MAVWFIPRATTATSLATTSCANRFVDTNFFTSRNALGGFDSGTAGESAAKGPSFHIDEHEQLGCIAGQPRQIRGGGEDIQADAGTEREGAAEGPSRHADEHEQLGFCAGQLRQVRR